MLGNLSSFQYSVSIITFELNLKILPNWSKKYYKLITLNRENTFGNN